MRLQPLFEDDFWEVWTRPRAYEQVRSEGSEHDGEAYLYYISARFSTKRPKVLYIGKTYNQAVSTRLTQRDHKSRYAAFVRNYPKHGFYVSHGIVSMTYGKLTRRRIDEVERILIHVNDLEHSHNIHME